MARKASAKNAGAVFFSPYVIFRLEAIVNLDLLSLARSRHTDLLREAALERAARDGRRARGRLRLGLARAARAIGRAWFVLGDVLAGAAQ